MMDLNTVDMKNPILGQDFLTWLWWQIERRGGQFASASGDHFLLVMEQKVSVQGGSGDGLETATVSGPLAEFREARLGLKVGKKVSRALLKLEAAGEVWTVQLKADDLTLNSLRTPKIEMKLEEGEDPDARFLEKIYLVERFMGYLDELYAAFARLRISPQAWAEELRGFREWLAREEE